MQVVSMLLWSVLATTTGIPTDVYISMMPSNEKQAVVAAINQVNADSSILPNTTLHFIESTLTDSQMLSFAINISKNNISALIVDSQPNESHDALSFMLRMPLISTDTYRATPRNETLGDYEISVGPSVISAMADIIIKYKWINLVVLYDVRWRDHATEFLSGLPSSVHYLTVDMILDRAGHIDDKSQKKILFLRNDPAEAVILLCDFQYTERIIKQVFPLFTFAPSRSHRWLLADPVKSFKMEADFSQSIMGFSPKIFNNAQTAYFHAALATNGSNTRLKSYLVFDAVIAFAHALNGSIADNGWHNVTSSDKLTQSKNGEILMEYIKKVNAVGTTGPIQFTSGCFRKEAAVDVVNLRDGQFIKIGDWSDSSGLTMTSTPTKNQVTSEVVPLSELKRKLRIAVVEDAPFVIKFFNKTTNKEELTGFSIDLVKEIASIMDFDYEFYITADGLYEGRNANGSLAGVIGDVYKGVADMSSMPLTINTERLQYIAFSKPFMYISMDMVVQRPKTKQYDILGFMTPYDNLVWIMTLVTWWVVTAALSFVNYHSPYGHRLCDEEQNGDEFSWFNSLWFCLACMLQQGGDTTPRMFSGRVIVGFFWFGILVWVSTYTANLASVLTTSQDQEEVTSIEEALEKEYHVYVIGGSAFTSYLEQSDYRVYRLVWERIISEKSFVNYTTQGFDAVREEDHKNVFIEESAFAEYLLSKKPCDVRSGENEIQLRNKRRFSVFDTLIKTRGMS